MRGDARCQREASPLIHKKLFGRHPLPGRNYFNVFPRRSCNGIFFFQCYDCHPFKGFELVQFCQCTDFSVFCFFIVQSYARLNGVFFFRDIKVHFYVFIVEIQLFFIFPV